MLSIEYLVCFWVRSCVLPNGFWGTAHYQVLVEFVLAPSRFRLESPRDATLVLKARSSTDDFSLSPQVPFTSSMLDAFIKEIFDFIGFIFLRISIKILFVFVLFYWLQVGSIDISLHFKCGSINILIRLNIMIMIFL